MTTSRTPSAHRRANRSKPAHAVRSTSPRKRYRFDIIEQTTTTWLTPKEWIDALGPFDLDPCTPPIMPWKSAARMLTVVDDGLATPWPKDEFVFHNPPYGRGQQKWMKKAAEHGNGITLVLNRADTQWFHDWVLKHSAVSALLFVEGRVKFCKADGKPSALSCPVPAILVAYGKQAAAHLRKANDDGVIPGVFFAMVHRAKRQLVKEV
jgi:hypothetical protein